MAATDVTIRMADKIGDAPRRAKCEDYWNGEIDCSQRYGSMQSFLAVRRIRNGHWQTVNYLV